MTLVHVKNDGLQHYGSSYQDIATLNLVNQQCKSAFIEHQGRYCAKSTTPVDYINKQ